MSKSIDKKKLFSASEIAEMRLPGLPTTIANIHARAKKEEWHYETKVGLGGIRKEYEIPAAYLPGYNPYPDGQPPVGPLRKDTPVLDYPAMAAKVVANSSDGENFDIDRFARAMEFVDKWEAKRPGRLTPVKKSRLVIKLYEYLATHEDLEQIEEVLQLVA